MTTTQLRYCYKVVKVDQSALRLTGLYYSDIIYQVGEWTKPPEGCGPLCVFDTLENAKQFIHTKTRHWEHPNLAIYICRIEPSSLNQVWHKRKSQNFLGCPLGPLSITYLPKGTVLANKIQLTSGGLKAYRGGGFCLKDAICGYEKL